MGGDARLSTLGVLQLGSSTGSVSVGEDMSGLVGGSMSVETGGDAYVSAAGSGGMVFGDGVSVSGGSSVSVSAAQELSMAGASVGVSASEGVLMSSSGSVVELEGAGEVEYVGFGWRSSSSFEEFSNVVPRVTAVTELIVRGSTSSAGRCRLLEDRWLRCGCSRVRVESGGRCGARRWAQAPTRWTVCTCALRRRRWLE